MEKLSDLFFGHRCFDALNNLDDFLNGISISDAVADKVETGFEACEPVRIFRWQYYSLDGGLGFSYLNFKVLVQKLDGHQQPHLLV